MNKKSFKDNTVNIDRFFSASETHGTHETQRTHGTHRTHYRMNLKLRPEFKEYLTDRAWQSRKSITEYINDLIQADMDIRGT